MKNETNNKTATIIATNGDITKVTPKNGKTFDLYEMQRIVGGLIDIVYYPNDKNKIMIVNDEGMYTKEFNVIASLYLTQHYKKECAIYGDVLICDDSMVR